MEYVIHILKQSLKTKIKSQKSLHFKYLKTYSNTKTLIKYFKK